MQFARHSSDAAPLTSQWIFAKTVDLALNLRILKKTVSLQISLKLFKKGDLERKTFERKYRERARLVNGSERGVSSREGIK